MSTEHEPTHLEHGVLDGLLELTVGDDYAPGPILALVESLAEDPTFNGPLPICIDYRAARLVPPADSIRTNSMRLARYAGTVFTRIAVVVSTDLQFGAFRVASTYHEIDGFELQIFRDPDDARTWLRSA